MRRLILTVAATIMFFIGAGFAEATVIYDWVTLGVEYGQDYKISASLKISDQEYYAGSFSRSYADLEDVVVTYLPGGTKYMDITFKPEKFETEHPYVLLGSLSTDRSTIKTLQVYVPDFQMYLPNFIFWDDGHDASIAMTVDSVDGGLDPYAFGLTGGPYKWDHFGEWASRTVPAVPEPGTFMLLGVGVIGMVFWRRSARR